MDVFNMIEDIVKFLNKDNKGNYEICKECIRFKYLFQGY